MSRYTPPPTAAQRALYAQVKAEEPLCWLCLQPVNPYLRWPHPESWSADHVIPVSVDPSLALVRSNLHSAHLRCNWKRGAKPAKPQVKRRPLTSQDW